MPSIGQVTLQANGSYKGRLSTLSIRQNIELVLNRKKAENQPDFRVLCGDVEIGAAWIRKAISSGKEFVSLSIAAPEFGDRTLYANLGKMPGAKDDKEFAIIWNPSS